MVQNGQGRHAFTTEQHKMTKKMVKWTATLYNITSNKHNMLQSMTKKQNANQQTQSN